jgi:hypothetical protein
MTYFEKCENYSLNTQFVSYITQQGYDIKNPLLSFNIWSIVIFLYNVLWNGQAPTQHVG